MLLLMMTLAFCAVGADGGAVLGCARGASLGARLGGSSSVLSAVLGRRGVGSGLVALAWWAVAVAALRLGRWLGRWLWLVSAAWWLGRPLVAAPGPLGGSARVGPLPARCWHRDIHGGPSRRLRLRLWRAARRAAPGAWRGGAVLSRVRADVTSAVALRHSQRPLCDICPRSCGTLILTAAPRARLFKKKR